MTRTVSRPSAPLQLPRVHGLLEWHDALFVAIARHGLAHVERVLLRGVVAQHTPERKKGVRVLASTQTHPHRHAHLRARTDACCARVQAQHQRARLARAHLYTMYPKPSYILIAIELDTRTNRSTKYALCRRSVTCTRACAPACAGVGA